MQNEKKTNNQSLINKKLSINEKELETLNFWNENKIFEKSILNPAGIGLDNKEINNENKKEEIKSFSFYDGPPFATGLPHHGHILAGTIKDVMPRYKTMTGHSVRRVWGWDCHGLPIENLIEKELNLNSKKEIEELGIEKFTKACAVSVLRYDTQWKSIVPRLGRWVDMDNAYKTMDWTYTESIWWAWKNLYQKGLAYEGYKIMHICPRCETPLAQSEVGLEYHDITDMTVTTEFKLKNKKYNNNDLYILAWTTTPWTLPGNTALAINKNLEYVIVEDKKINKETSLEQIKYFVVAKKLSEKVFKNSEAYKVVKEINIDDYIGENYEPPFQTFNNEKFLSALENSENIWKVWHADFITDESGTGIAHEAPAFGTEDMELAKINNIPVIKHVLMNGHFVSDVENNLPELKDLVVKKKDDSITTDIEIVKLLAHSGKLFSKEKIVHSYPLCWRCKTPLLNYATSSWFIDVPKIKDKLISENKKVNWVPEHTRDGRFGKWLEGAREWAVSRKRYWGAPLPIWKSEKTGEIFVAGSLKDISEKQKSNNEYFVMRHGEAISNVNMIIDSSGDVDNHLTAKGKVQVEDTLKNCSDSFDIIISSPFVRTLETAKIMANGKEIVIDDRLHETNLGVYDKMSVDYYIKEMGEVDYLKLNTRPKDGETHGEMMNRCMAVIEDLEKNNENKKILLVTHAGPMRMMIAGAELITEEELIKDELAHDTRLYPKNAELRKINYKKVSRDETGAINLHRPYIDKVILKDRVGNDMKLIGDVFDCWFESGSMPFASRHYPFENKETVENNFQADFIAEGVDQTRGWFYSLINLGVGLFDKVPFKNVIVNGHVMAKGGEKMSKSLKNYTDPMELVEKYGADALRFALVNSPAMRGEQLEMPDTLVEEVYKKNIQRLENVFDFYQMYSEGVENLEANNNSENILDKWILTRLQEIINEHVTSFENYKLDEAVKGVDKFVDDFSTWYLRRSRDRLKADLSINSENTELEKEDKLQALETIKYIFVEFSKTIAPVMPFLAERLYKETLKTKDSVHLQKYPEKKDINEESKKVLEDMFQARNVVTEVLMMRQKQNVPVRQPLSSLTLNKSINIKVATIVMEEINIKNIKYDTNLENSILDFTLTPELIREGKQRELSREIKDKRKEMGLVSADFIILSIEESRLELIDGEYKKEMKIKEVKESEVLKIEKVN